MEYRLMDRMLSADNASTALNNLYSIFLSSYRHLDVHLALRDITNPLPDKRIAAAYDLSTSGTTADAPEIYKTILDAIRHESDSDVLYSFLSALETITVPSHTEDVSELLCFLLKHKRGHIRIEVIKTLVRFGYLVQPTDTVANALIERIKYDTVVDVRRWAVIALSKSPNTHFAVEIHQALLNEPDESVKAEARRLIIVERGEELAEVELRLDQARCLTLIGPSGCGKTWLARRFAEKYRKEYASSVFFVSLSSLEAGATIQEIIASHLGMPSNKVISEFINLMFPAKKVLLIVDNCDQFREACAELANNLLPRCPQASILFTARNSLQLTKNQAWEVPPLTTPQRQAHYTSHSLMGCGATQLLVRKSGISDQLFGTNTQHIANITQNLGGVPLAVNMVASRIVHVGVEQTYQEVQELFAPLHTGSSPKASTSDQHGRQISITDTALREKIVLKAIDWSYELLKESDRQFLRCLSVFEGGWSIDAATQVCAGHLLRTNNVPSLLHELEERGLIVFGPSGLSQELRFLLLDSVKDFVKASLPPVLRRELQKRHFDYYCATARQIRSNCDINVTPSVLNRAALDHDNFRVALQWAVSQDDVAENGLSLASGIAPYWTHRGFVQEGLYWLLKFWEATHDVSDIRAEAANAIAILHYHSGNYTQSLEMLQTALEIRRNLGQAESRAIASILDNLGVIQGTFETTKDLQIAQRYLEAGLEMRRNIGTASDVANSLMNIGRALFCKKEYENAFQHFEEATHCFRNTGDGQDVRLATALNGAGASLLKLNRFKEAEDRLKEALMIYWAIKSVSGLASSYENLSELAFNQRDYSRAPRLFAFAQKLRESNGITVPPIFVSEHLEYKRRMKDAIEERAFTHEWEIGEHLSSEATFDYAISN